MTPRPVAARSLGSAKRAKRKRAAMTPWIATTTKPRHRWAKALRGWVCTVGANHFEWCGRQAVRACDDEHCKAPCGDGRQCTGEAGRCKKHLRDRTGIVT